ncbi:MAG: hypothetical protein NC218_02190 [Acetobacter sp.]|nr:hypothetical protein [Acetobacter sp.]
MKTLELSVEQYNAIIDACSYSVDNARYAARPNLAFIHVIVCTDHIEAVALDGYQLAKFVTKGEFEEEFDFLLRPIRCKCKFKNSEIASVRITFTEETGYVEVRMPEDSGGYVTYSYTVCEEFNIKADAIIGEDSTRPHTICIDANKLIRAAKSLKNFTRGYCKIALPDNKSAGITITTEDDKGKLVHYILPIRHFE